MRLLIDTQILVWLVSSRERLSEREHAAIAQASELMVSVLSLYELRVKNRAERRKGLMPSTISPMDAIAFCEARDIVIHPLQAHDTTIALPDDPVHGDPFDEMLLAHAQALQARLLTRDGKLRDHPLAHHP